MRCGSQAPRLSRTSRCSRANGPARWGGGPAHRSGGAPAATAARSSGTCARPPPQTHGSPAAAAARELSPAPVCGACGHRQSSSRAKLGLAAHGRLWRRASAATARRCNRRRQARTHGARDAAGPGAGARAAPRRAPPSGSAARRRAAGTSGWPPAPPAAPATRRRCARCGTARAPAAPRAAGVLAAGVLRWPRQLVRLAHSAEAARIATLHRMVVALRCTRTARHVARSALTALASLSLSSEP